MIELETRISAVTVFKNGARVTRSGRQVLESGPQRIAVRGITEQAHHDSFRVKGRGPFTFKSIDIKTETRTHEPGGKIKDLQQELESLQKEELALQNEYELYSKRLNNLDTMITEFSNIFGTAFAANEVDITNLTDMDRMTNSLVEETQNRLREITYRLRDVRDKITVLKQNIENYERSTRWTETTYTVVIDLEVTQKAEVEIDLTYQCEGAGWTPNYSVDLSPRRAQLRRVAMVTNRTREAWEDVTLTVSTASARPVEAVEPTPHIIDIYIPIPEAEPPERLRFPKKMAKEAAPMAPAGLPEAEPPSPIPELEEVTATVTEAPAGVSIYKIPVPVSIPADNESHPVTLIEEELESNTVYYWNADAMAEVVAQDEVTNGNSVILAGKVRVFAEGEYIGETFTEQIAPREKFKIGTRTAYQVKAKKKLVHREVEKTGVVRGRLRRAYTYRLEIENFGKEPIRLEVVDRIPHSLNPAIEVKIDSERLGLKKFELGVMQWDRTIRPKEKDVIEYSFEVLWERGVRITPPLP